MFMFELEDSYCESFSFSPDSSQLALANFAWSGGPHVKLWDMTTRALIRILVLPTLDGIGAESREDTSDEYLVTRQEDTGAEALCFSPDGLSLATVPPFGKHLVLWQLADDGLRHLHLPPQLASDFLHFDISGPAFSPDGVLVAQTAGCPGFGVRRRDDYSATVVWHTSSGMPVFQVPHHFLTFSPCGSCLITCDDDGLRFWRKPVSLTQLQTRYALLSLHWLASRERVLPLSLVAESGSVEFIHSANESTARAQTLIQAISAGAPGVNAARALERLYLAEATNARRFHEEEGIRLAQNRFRSVTRLCMQVPAHLMRRITRFI
jgi:WD40 repeat protein